MSKATKRKHVTREVLEDFIEPGPEQKIAKVNLSSIFSYLLYRPTIGHCVVLQSVI